MGSTSLLLASIGVGLGVGAYFLLDWQYNRGKEAQASSADLQVLLCEDTLKRRTATEQDLTRFIDRGDGVNLPLSIYGRTRIDPPTGVFATYAREWDRLHDILSETTVNIDAHCLPSQSAVTAREERLEKATQRQLAAELEATRNEQEAKAQEEDAQRNRQAIEALQPNAPPQLSLA